MFFLLPHRAVAEQLKLGKPVTPEYFDEVTIYFSEIMAFIDLASESTPMEVGKPVLINVPSNFYTFCYKKRLKIHKPFFLLDCCISE